MRYSTLTASFLTSSLSAAFLLGACTEASQTDAETGISPDPVFMTDSGSTHESPAQEKSAALKAKPLIDLSAYQALPAKYQGLDRKEISRAEIEEMIALEEVQAEALKTYRKAHAAWLKEDPASRGPQPKFKEPPQNTRLQVLYVKLQIAGLHKKYAKLGAGVLTKSEIEEMMALERDQLKQNYAFREKIQAWAKQDPATRGPHPQTKASFNLANNPRMRKLRAKLDAAKRARSVKHGVQQRAKRLNISIPDTEISELVALQTELQMLQTKINAAKAKARRDSQLAGRPFNASANAAGQSVPADVTQRMAEINRRLQAIQAPLAAAEQGVRTRNRLTQLSKASGIPFLSGEIEEMIALEAERDSINNKARLSASTSGLPGFSSGHTAGQIGAAGADHERLKEINDRIREISAPMTQAQEAANPVMKQQRLAKEAQQKWQADWQERKQSGEVPANARLISPSYAELQDRAENYAATLKSRADEVGYNFSTIELSRLKDMDDRMVAIRETVHDRQVDGSALYKNDTGQNIQTFAVTANMQKIRLLEAKRQNILKGLTEAERSVSAASQTRAQNFNRNGFTTFNGQYAVNNNRQAAVQSGFDAEAYIQRFRDHGVKVTQSDADDLIAFARELENER